MTDISQVLTRWSRSIAAPVGLLLALIAQDAAANSLGQVYATVSAVSDSRHDGASRSNGKPTGQASVYLWRPDKLYAGVFVTGVDYGYDGSPSVEVDIYAGRHFDLKKTRVTLQAMYSVYAGQSGWGPTFDFFQATAKVQRQVGKATLTGAVEVTPQGSFGSGQGWRVSGEAVYPATDWLSLSGKVSHNESKRGTPRNSWDLGATVKKGPVSLDLRYYDADVSRAQCYGTDWCEAAVVGKLSYDLPFGRARN